MSKKEKSGNWFGRHKVLTVLGGIVILIIIISIATNSGGNNKASVASTKKSGDSSQAETVAKIGDSVRDGKFEFTVTGMKCGQTEVGDQYLNTKAQGQFCRLHMKVKNIGNEAQTLDDTAQYVYNAKGQKYSADSDADIYASSDSNSDSTWYNNINPGNSVSGDIYFDVPKNVTPVKAELHDSAFSGGVTVELK